VYEILSEAAVEGLLGVGQWHHLAANVRDYILNRKTVIEVRFLYCILLHSRCHMLLNVARTADPVCWWEYQGSLIVATAGILEMLAEQEA
jgi:hypothetical protein